MRRRSLLIAVPAGLITLAACGDDGNADTAGDSPSPSAPATSSPPAPEIVDGPLPAITAGTDFGQKPTVAKGSGDPSDRLAVRTVIAGNGRTVAENDYVLADYLGQVWSTAEVFDNSYDRGAPIAIQLSAGSVIDGWRYALSGKKVDSRVEFSVPPTWGYGDQGNEDAGIAGDDTLVFVVDLVDAFDAESSAEGTEVPQDDAALPRVGTNTDGKAPAIQVPDVAPPEDLVADYILEGDGPEVGADDNVLVQYEGVLWDGGEVFDSTYSRGQLASFSLQQVVQGWSQGLTGKKVGSRLLVVVPPDLGYGDDPPQGSPIQKDSTLVFSVDILAKM
ncbi:FKBP-type peptidyl-prolyl cis-trans isomerase [Streptomyces sp. ZYX-F-203]